MTDTQAPTETEATENGNVKIAIPTDKYVTAKAAGGGTSKHNGDAVATALQGQSLEVVLDLASQILDVPAGELEAKYAHLNVGQQRMNLGNRIRGAVNKMNKIAESEAGQKDGAVSGDSFLAQIAEPYVAELEERLEAEAEAKAEADRVKAEEAKAKEEAKAAKAEAKKSKEVA
jgi:nucleoid-associated protein YgaU